MLDVRQILRIAAGYRTAMADAMFAACVDWYVRHNVPLPTIDRAAASAARVRVERAEEDIDWERMVRGNSDIIGPRGHR